MLSILEHTYHLDRFHLRENKLHCLDSDMLNGNLAQTFSKFNRRHFDIVSKYNVGLKTLLLQGLSEPEFYGDLVYKFRKLIGKNDFPYHFKKIVVRLCIYELGIFHANQTTKCLRNIGRTKGKGWSTEN